MTPKEALAIAEAALAARTATRACALTEQRSPGNIAVRDARLMASRAQAALDAALDAVEKGVSQ